MKKGNSEIFKYLSMVTQVGICVIVPMLLLTLLGVWIDKKAGTELWGALLCILGLLGGMTSAWNLLKKFVKENEKEEKYDLMEGFSDSGKKEKTGEQGREEK